jgi:hypothetical protein
VIVQRKFNRLFALLFACFGLAAVAHAGNIIYVLEGATPEVISADQSLAVHWNQTMALPNWTLNVFGLSYNPVNGSDPANVNFELWQGPIGGVQIGVTTTVQISPGGLISSPPFQAAGPPPELTPGEYYLVASRPAGDPVEDVTWLSGGAATFDPTQITLLESVSLIQSPEGPILAQITNGQMLGFQLDDGAIGAVVPEPSTLILLGAGLAAFGFMRRRKKA